MRFAMVQLALLPLVMACIASPYAGAGETDTPHRIVGLPPSETLSAVLPWLQTNAFRVMASTRFDQATQMEVERHGIRWTIRLSAHSPLATRIVVTPEDPADATFGTLWDHLDAYISRPRQEREQASNETPASVQAAHAAVVCIHADSEGTPLRLSGFAIDPTGLILSTAHDLRIDQKLTVYLNDGRTTGGRVVALDNQRDLTLIQIALPPPEIIEAHNGKHMPDPRMPLYAIGCSPAGDRSDIRRGTLDGPPRLVAGMPLWQARLTVEPGSSGSPVLDADGRLIAVVKGRFRGSQSIGFLIPLESLLQFLENR